MDNKNTIEVSGTGTFSKKPDEAIVYLGMLTQSADAVTAQKDNAAKMEKVIKALRDAGIQKDDIETSNYTMYPVRDQAGEKRELDVEIRCPLQASTSGGTFTTDRFVEAKSLTTPIEPGKITASAFVSVIYQFE